MQETNDARFDLDLLRAFRALYEQRHVTKASSVLGISQSAMSHALGRLRESFDDPLFIRTARGMLPTPRADVLSEEVSRILADIESLLAKKKIVSPKELKRSYSIASADYGHIVLLPSLVRLLAKEAPEVDLVCGPMPEEMEPELERGTIDLVLGVSSASTKLMCQKLYDEKFVCVLRRGHPALKRGFDLKRYAELSHILVAPRGRPGGAVDRALAAHGHTRRVRVRVTSFVTALMLVAESEMILTAPERMVARFGRKLPLAVKKPPIQVQGFSIWQYWHERVHRDPEHEFLRACVTRAAQA